MDRFRRLLEHWIEHNEEHIEKYREWMEKLKDHPEIFSMLKDAVEKFEEGTRILEEIKRRV
ncbi:MAG: hypothetical protein PWQ22_29 [Archaeoglobaceae archaeon]|nr:hypothetical protein [Archaeoglobaceae archaeon]MDK2875619.1 hypothetical protein [Archaeoglobaceae archaeon]